MHSALKHEGVPLYSLARRGEEVERAPRRVHDPRARGRAVQRRRCSSCACVCSKGTYIRTLAEDIGEALGSGAHLRGAAAHRLGALPRSSEAVDLDALAARCSRAPSDGCWRCPACSRAAARRARRRRGSAPAQRPVIENRGPGAGLCAVYGPTAGDRPGRATTPTAPEAARGSPKRLKNIEKPCDRMRSRLKSRAQKVRRVERDSEWHCRSRRKRRS